MVDNFEEQSYEVEFLNCVVDKADDFKIIDGDSHFSEFSGVHPSKIKQGKLFLQDILKPLDRQTVFKNRGGWAKTYLKKAEYYFVADISVLFAL